jgi:hypothetical protein
MLGDFLGSQFNEFNSVDLHFIVRLEVKLYLINVFVSMKLDHFHDISFQLPRNFFLESFALFGGSDKDGLLSLDLHVFVGERQYLDQSHPHVLVKFMVKEIFLGFY